MIENFLRTVTALASIPFLVTAPMAQENRSSERLGGAELKKALNDEAADFWIYDDLEHAYAEGKRTGKPVLVSFRCVP